MSLPGLWLRRAAAAVGAVVLALAGCKGGCGKEAPKGAARPELALRSMAKVHEVKGLRYALPYRLFVPKDYDGTRRYPLILYLHHGENRGTDNLAQLNEELAQIVSPEVQAIEPCFVVAPQCPLEDQWVNAAKEPMPFRNYVQAEVPEADVAKLTMDLVRTLGQEYSFDPARIYVTGSSMGASGAWDYVTRYAGVFAAAVPINGINDPARAPAIAKLPIWAFHGEKDPVSTVENSRTMVAALRKLGSPVKYSELAGKGHGIGVEVLGNLEVYRWLFAQRLAAP